MTVLQLKFTTLNGYCGFFAGLTLQLLLYRVLPTSPVYVYLFLSCSNTEILSLGSIKVNFVLLLLKRLLKYIQISKCKK